MKYYLILIMLIAGVAQATESGSTIKSDTLRAAPYSDAAVIVSLPAATKVEIIKKDGGWMQIKSSQGSGWIRMLSIRRGDTRTGSADLAGLANLASGRSGTGKIVSTTGIRGLNEEELKSARYDDKQLTLAESFLTGRGEAQKFAAQAKLKTQQLNYLPGAAK